MSPGSQPNAASTDTVRSESSRAQVSVCHLASGDLWAGAEAQVSMLLAALAQRSDVSVCAIFLNEGRLAESARSKGVDVRVIPETGFGFAGILRESAKYLRGRNIRVLHSHRYKENLLAAWLARRCRVPVLVRTQHGMPEPFHGFKGVKQRFVQALNGMAARYTTDAVIAVSQEMGARLGRSLPRGKVTVIHNGIDTQQVESRYSPAEAKQRLGLPQHCPVLGTAGRLEPIKRVDRFLAVARLIAAHQPEARFLVVGEGSEKPGLVALSRSLGIADRVLFLGHRDDIFDVYRAMDAFLLCSDDEGLPTVLLEALWLGVPVAARSVGGVPEVIRDGHNGLLVASNEPQDLAAACLTLLTGDKLRMDFARAGQALVREKFDSTRMAAEVAALYFRLCGLS